MYVERTNAGIHCCGHSLAFRKNSRSGTLFTCGVGAYCQLVHGCLINFSAASNGEEHVCGLVVRSFLCHLHVVTTSTSGRVKLSEYLFFTCLYI